MPEDMILLTHGGAGSWDRKVLYNALKSLEKISIRAFEVLKKENALKAVLFALNLLEDDPIFNAGRGSNLNLFGEIELDASIMVGKEKKAGAVASVKNVKYASSLAKIVMDKTPHVLLTGWATEYLADKNELKVNESELLTERRLSIWRRGVKILLKEIGEEELDERDKIIKAYLKNKLGEIYGFIEEFPEVLGKIRRKLIDSGNTVGVVAYKNGDIVAGTSTGGLPLKLPGRIGDTPLIGAGTYADNTLGGASATGHGETIILNNLAIRVVLSLKTKSRLEENIIELFNSLYPRPEAGIIAINKRGEWVVAHTTRDMPVAVNINGDLEVKANWLKI